MNKYIKIRRLKYPIIFLLVIHLAGCEVASCEDRIITYKHPLINITSPIKIMGNDFSSSDGVSGGNGSHESPYIIQGHEIVFENAPAISISDSTAHVVIRNVRIHSIRNAEASTISEISSIANGIELKNVKHVTIEEVQISGVTGTGIAMSNAEEVAIRRSKISNAREGIYAKSVRNLIIEDNEIAFMLERGMNLGFPLDEVIVRGNNVHHTATNGVGGEGIEAFGGDPTDRIIVENNKVHNIADDGIEFVNLKNSFIINNSSVNNMGQGIDLFEGSNNNIISNNFIDSNQQIGIFVTNSNNNRFIDNVIFGNSPAGIRFQKYGDDTTGSIGNVLSGLSPWGNGSNVIDDTRLNRIVYAGTSSSFPLTSENQIISDYDEKLPKRVEYHFRHSRTEVLAKFSDGTELKTEKRSPPYINFDLIPQEGLINYNIQTFDLNAKASEVFFDIKLERVSGKGKVNISINQLPENHDSYEIIYNKSRIEEIRSSGNSLTFSVDIVDKINIVLRPKLHPISD